MTTSTTQTHYFPANDARIKTELQPNGEYTAIDAENYDLGSPMGWGRTRLEAIADLTEQMIERELI